MNKGLQTCLDSDENFVYYIGHASALARIDKRLLLFDPIWDHQPYGDNWTLWPEQVSLDALLPQIDACFVSHLHEDHFCPAILRKLNELQIPIYAMSGRQAFDARCEKEGIKINLLPSGVWIDNPEGAEVLIVPHAFNNIDSSFFVRSTKSNYCIYQGNDNFLTKTVINWLKPMIEQLDIAMLPHQFIHWYPHLLANMLPQERANELTRLQDQSLSQAQDFIGALKPKVVIPFGASLYYKAPLSHPLNSCMVAYADKLVSQSPLVAGDYVIGSEIRGWQMSWAEWRRGLERELERCPIRDRDVLNEEDLCFADAIEMTRRLRKATFTIPNQLIIVNDYVFDCETLEASIRHPHAKYPNKNNIRFELEAEEYNSWRLGDITLEQAIGTRRFTCVREPNIYNAKVFEFMNSFL